MIDSSFKLGLGRTGMDLAPKQGKDQYELMLRPWLCCLSICVGVLGLLWTVPAVSDPVPRSQPHASSLAPSNENAREDEIADCLPLEMPKSTAFEPGCFGWSETRKVATCVIGSYSGDRSSRFYDGTWRMISLPDGLVSQGCEMPAGTHQGIGSLVLGGKRLLMIRKKLENAQVDPLPKDPYSLEPRNTLDLSYPSGRKFRLRWNQMLLETRDNGFDKIPIYRDRISMVCSKTIGTGAETESNPSVEIFPNAKAPAFLHQPKKREDTLYLDETPGSAEAKVYSLSKGRYVLVAIGKTNGEFGGAISGSYTAVLVDTNRCRVSMPRE